MFGKTKIELLESTDLEGPIGMFLRKSDQACNISHLL